MVRIAVVAGSVRSGSFNVLLARAAVEHLEAHGATATWVDLATFDLPLYAAGIEAERFPADALRLKQLLAAQHGVLFTSPEYNGSVSPLLKNAIDWASRPTDGEGPVALTAYRGKAAAIMSASLSPFGGLRGLMQLRQILTTIQMLVIPDQLAVPNAHQAFCDDGRLRDPLQASLLDSATARLVKVAAALSG